MRNVLTLATLLCVQSIALGQTWELKSQGVGPDPRGGMHYNPLIQRVVCYDAAGRWSWTGTGWECEPSLAVPAGN